MMSKTTAICVVSLSDSGDVDFRIFNQVFRRDLQNELLIEVALHVVRDAHGVHDAHQIVRLLVLAVVSKAWESIARVTPLTNWQVHW